jgi:TP901 family phage tail tape measure protein
MAGNEWVVKVTADVKGVLDASRQIGQAGKQAGQEFKQGFGGNDKMLEKLSGQLKELDKGVNSNVTTLGGLKTRLSELDQTLNKAAIGSKEFVAAQRQIAQTQKEVDKALGGGGGIIKGLGQELKGFALQAGAVLSAGSALQFVGKQITELDSAGAAVRTLGVNSDELKDKLFDLSIELDSNISRVELLKASYDVASSGFSTVAQITDILRASSLGAAGGFAELNDVARALTGVINAYGLTTADATSIVDGFVQTQADGVITVREYAEQIGTVASVAAAAGIPLAELNAAISAATLKGVPVAQTFTGIRQAISSILKPSEQAKDLAASLGISFDLAGLQARGFGGFLADVQAKGGGAADKLAILLGSVEAQTAVQPLLNKAAEVATDSIAGGIKKIENAISNLATTAGESLPEVSNYLSTLAKIIELTGKFNKEVAPTIGAAGQANVAPVVTSITNAAKAFQVATKDLDLYEKALASVKLTYASLITSVQGFILGNDGAKKATQDFQNQLIELLGLNKLFNTESAKQPDITAKANQQKEIAKILAKDLLDKQAEHNRLALIELDNAIALGAARDKLSKAQSDSLISLQQASINLGQALVSLENSRFGIAKSRNDYELKNAQDRKASEFELDAIKRRGEQIEQAALNFKYQALVQQQALQTNLLSLQQQQASLEANLTVSTARIEVKKAELALTAAQNTGNAEAVKQAQLALDIANLELEGKNAKLQILGQIQPIEERIANANSETARNGIIAEAAAKGLQLAADGTFQKVKDTANSFKSYGDSLKVPLAQQGAFAQLAKDVGLEVRTTRDGFVQIGQTLGRTSSPAANNIKTYMSDAAKATNAARNQASALANNMGNAAGSAEAFYRSLAAASGLPPSRFTGGPVDAGQTYRINDGPSGMSLGQEAFLSASGALSLLNRPANSLWTAPSRGTVIPANVTSRLKESGALGGGAAVLRGGSDPAVAHLALAVGNLSQEVAELRRKAWNVSVGMRGDGSGLRLAQTTARMF